MCAASAISIAAISAALGACATKSPPKPSAPPVERRTGEVSESIVESGASSR